MWNDTANYKDFYPKPPNTASLTEPAQFVFFILGWGLLPISPIRWTLLGLGSVAAPWIVALALAVIYAVYLVISTALAIRM